MDAQVRQGADAAARLHARRRFRQTSVAHGAIGTLRLLRNAAAAGDPPAVRRRGSRHGGPLAGEIIEFGRVASGAHSRALDGLASAVCGALRDDRTAALRAEIRLSLEGTAASPRYETRFPTGFRAISGHVFVGAGSTPHRALLHFVSAAIDLLESGRGRLGSLGRYADRRQGHRSRAPGGTVSDDR